MTLLEKIKQGFVFFDGGYGTILQANGLKAGELPETYNVLHPEMITDIHYEYLMAGSQILKTNTFGCNALKFPEDGDMSLEKLVFAAVENARKAIKKAGKVQGEDAYIALDLGPTGKLLEPLGDLPFEKAVSLYAQVTKSGVNCGVDCVLIETMNDGYEAKAAVLGVKENCDLPVFVTTVYDENGKSLTGSGPKNMVALLEGLGVDALGLNCSLGPKKMLPIVQEIFENTSIPVIANPNAGLPKVVDATTVFEVDAEAFAEEMKELVKAGARVLGGCCGTTPSHIGAMISAVSGLEPKEITEKTDTMISSYSKVVAFEDKPILIGERINPTGKSKFKQALRDHDIEYILREGLAQEEKKVHVLDVNLGLPEIDEAAMLKEVVVKLQSVIDLPLQIDTSDPVALESALRVYNGKALINSVNGKEESMQSVFPLVKKYGGVVVALTLDENGIPETVEGRLAIAEKIYKRAAEYGIAKKDIIVDVLTMSISTDGQAANTTLDAVSGIKEKFGGKTILGVSNVSFGLPNRDYINATFFANAMERGLSAAIMNPNSIDMLKAYYAFCALKGYDDRCVDYVEFATIDAPKMMPAVASSTATAGGVVSTGGSTLTNGSASEGASDMQSPLMQAIIKGMKESAVTATKQVLAGGAEAFDVIQREIIPALDIVGKGFEKKTIFLPQLLMSAEAATAAFDVIKSLMKGSDSTGNAKGKIVLATVKGDIHDIGKNIVKVLLENYGYDVIDLGKDVPIEVVVDVVLKHQIKLVGLSALMTTTVPSMEKTIVELRKASPDCKVMVGGAVLTREYADMIKADAYCKDAMEAVRYAESYFA